MQGVFGRKTHIVLIRLVNLLSQVMHEFARIFCQKFAPSGCFDNVFGYVVHVDQAADLIVVKDVQNFYLQTPFLRVFRAIICSVRVGTLNFKAAYNRVLWLFLVSDCLRFARNLMTNHNFFNA